MNNIEIVSPREGSHRRGVWEAFFSEWEFNASSNPREVCVADVSETSFPKERSDLMQKLMAFSDDSDDVEVEEEEEEDEDEEENIEEYESDEEVKKDIEQHMEERCNRLHKEDEEEELVIKEAIRKIEIGEEMIFMGASNIDSKKGSDTKIKFLLTEEDDREALFLENNRLREIARVIEIDLRSSIKDMLYKLIESKILQLPDFRTHLRATQRERHLLHRRLPRDDISIYIRFLKKTSCLPEIFHVVEIELRSDLRMLLSMRDKVDLDGQEKLNECLIKEWERLKGVLPMKYLLLYAAAVLEGIRQQMIH